MHRLYADDDDQSVGREVRMVGESSASRLVAARLKPRTLVDACVTEQKHQQLSRGDAGAKYIIIFTHNKHEANPSTSSHLEPSIGSGNHPWNRLVYLLRTGAWFICR